MHKPTPNFLAALVALVALATFGGLAYGADVTVSGVNATQNTDGSAIPQDGSPNSLKDVRVQYGTCNATDTGIPTVTNTVTVNLAPTDATFSRVVTGLALQKYCFRARHTNVGGTQSDWSSVVARDLTPVLRKPRPPGTVTVATLYEDMQESAAWAARAFAPIVFES